MNDTIYTTPKKVNMSILDISIDELPSYAHDCPAVKFVRNERQKHNQDAKDAQLMAKLDREYQEYLDQQQELYVQDDSLTHRPLL